MRKNIVFVLLLILLGVLGVSLVVGAENTRAAALALLDSEARPVASVSASVSVSGGAPSALPPASASVTAPEPKPSANRSLSVVGLDWRLMVPALVAAGGVKSGPESSFGEAGVEVSLAVASTMVEVERRLVSGGGSEQGSDLAVVPLSELVAAYERLRALDLCVFFVSGWSRGHDKLTGPPLSKLPASGNITLGYSGGPDALALGLLSLDLAGTALDRVKIEERSPSALLQAKSGGLTDQRTDEQEEIVFTTSEASHLLPYVLVAPLALLEEREAVLASFVQGFIAGTDALLKDRLKVIRRLEEIEGVGGAISVHSIADLELVRLYENAELLGLSGRGAVSIEQLIDWQFRVRRAAHLGRSSTPEAPLVDERVVARLVRSQPKLLQAPEASKRKASAGESEVLLARAFPKEDEQPIVEALGLLSGVFPRESVRLTLSGRPANVPKEWLDRAAARYDIDRARLLVGSAPPKPGRAALVEVLRAP